VSDQPGVLIVDVDPLQVSTISSIVDAYGRRLVSTSDFTEARRLLHEDTFDLVVTNLRLGTFNGIHLAYLTKMARPAARVLVYAREHDRMLAAEAQAAGAFYERQDFILLSVPAFMTAMLPETDRRNADVRDRRTMFRGGRRTTDVAVLDSTPAL
jgi:DNA-binding NtrC family response regulator